jgi:hypothetical protein
MMCGIGQQSTTYAAFHEWVDMTNTEDMAAISALARGWAVR